MNHQDTQQLGLFEAAKEDKHVVWLESYLLECGNWMTANALALLVGRPEGEESRRWVRSLAQVSDWVISGQKGYKHVKHATAEEVNHFVAWMESQATRMAKRAERMRKNAHAVLG